MWRVEEVVSREMKNGLLKADMFAPEDMFALDEDRKELRLEVMGSAQSTKAGV
jgi:hypothetical protein